MSLRKLILLAWTDYRLALIEGLSSRHSVIAGSDGDLAVSGWNVVFYLSFELAHHCVVWRREALHKGTGAVTLAFVVVITISISKKDYKG